MNGKKKATNEEKRIEYTVRNENFSPDGHSTKKKSGTVTFWTTKYDNQLTQNGNTPFFTAMNA